MGMRPSTGEAIRVISRDLFNPAFVVSLVWARCVCHYPREVLPFYVRQPGT